MKYTVSVVRWGWKVSNRARSSRYFCSTRFAAGSAEEWHTRIDEAAPLLAGVGNAHSLNALYCIAVDSALRRGCDAEAAMYLNRSVPLARDQQQPSHWLHALNHVGLAALLRDDSAAADEAFREALPLSHDLGLSPQLALTGLAAVAALQGRPERAARLAGAIAAHYGATHDDVELLRLETEFLEPARLRWGLDTWDASARQGAVLKPAGSDRLRPRITTRPRPPPPQHNARRDRPRRLILQPAHALFAGAGRGSPQGQRRARRWR